jgi:LAO/AO transport system kinase
VVVVPGLGDDIQAIKAGILEVADVFAVNKSDREGADRTVRDLRSMLELSHSMRREGAAQAFDIPIVKCTATQNEGVGDLWNAIDAHWEFLASGSGKLERETLRARTELVEILRERMLRAAVQTLSAEGARLDDLALRIARREVDPYTVADEAEKAAAGGLGR